MKHSQKRKIALKMRTHFEKRAAAHGSSDLFGLSGIIMGMEPANEWARRRAAIAARVTRRHADAHDRATNRKKAYANAA